MLSWLHSNPTCLGECPAPETARLCDLFPISLSISPPSDDPGPDAERGLPTLLTLNSASSQASSLIYDQLFALQMCQKKV